MKTRNILYGYCYEEGKIVRHIEESKIVEEMSRAYLHGQSLLEIAESLNGRKIEYMPGLVGWNKSRIMRLLEDKRYLGTDLFPAVMTKETYDAIQEIRNAKNTQKEVDRNADIFQIEIPVCCPKCGGKLRRKVDRRSTIATRWICKNEVCHTVVGKEDSTFISDIVGLLNEIIESPDKITIPPRQERAQTEGEIARVFSDSKTDREGTRRNLLEYATKQYEGIDGAVCQSQRLRDIFIHTRPMQGFNRELFFETVDEVKLYTDGMVGLVLENRQEICGGGTYGTR